MTLLEEVEYDSLFLQGQVGDIDFGFIGITSSQPIIRFVFDFTNNDDIAIQYDDLIFSTEVVPAPTTGAQLLLAGLALARRRR